MAACLTVASKGVEMSKCSRAEPGMKLKKSCKSWKRANGIGMRMSLAHTKTDGLQQVLCGHLPLAIENVEYSQNTSRLSGCIAVQNVPSQSDVNLRVYIRYSTDNWMSFTDVDAHFLYESAYEDETACVCDSHFVASRGVYGLSHVGIKHYGFSIRLGRLIPGKRVEFVLCYEEDGISVYRDDEDHGVKNLAEVILLSSDGPYYLL